jgi:hypothetical protein
MRSTFESDMFAQKNPQSMFLYACCNGYVQPEAKLDYEQVF